MKLQDLTGKRFGRLVVVKRVKKENRGEIKMTIYIDENGNKLDICEEKNKEVIKNLQEVLNEFLEEKRVILAMKKQPKLGYRFMKQIMLQLAKYPPMKLQEYVDVDYETISHYYIKFSELIAYYNRYFEIVDNKNIFMRYLGVDADQYERLEQHTDERIRKVMKMVDADYIGMGWVAGESGETDGKTTNMRLRASGNAGHSVITAVEQKTIDTFCDGMTDLEFKQKLEQKGIKVLG